MTEHAAVIFVFFFLAEYASIVLICILNAILFFGGYIQFDNIYNIHSNANTVYYYSIEGILYALWLAIKSCMVIFTFIWVRASFPRIRFDQLMSYSWTKLLPVVIALIIIFPCAIYGLDNISNNVFLL